MDEKLSSLLIQECFYLRTSLDWLAEMEVRQDKCLVMAGEKGRGSLLVGEEEYVVDKGVMLFLPFP